MKTFATLLMTALVCLAVPIGCGKAGKPIESLEDAKSARVGVMTGSTGEGIAKAKLPAAQVKSFDDTMDAIAALKAGQVDAVIVGYPTGFFVTRKNPDLCQLPGKMADEETAVAIRKGDDELLAQVNRIILDARNDGTLADMRKRWFKTDLSPYQELDLAVPERGRALRVGVCATREPMTFVDRAGRVTGHDGDLARLIGTRLGRPLEFSNMKFSALIPALQSGKVDLIVTGMTETAERQKMVNFTQSYFSSAQVMLARRAPPREDRTSKLASPADLHDKRIGVLLGSAQGVYSARTYPKATTLQFKTAPDLVLAVKTGKIDAALYDRELLLEVLRGNQDLDFLGDALFTIPIGAGFHKDSGRLRSDFNEFLRQIRQNGVYNDMVDRWMLKGDTRMPEIAHAKTNGILVVGMVNDIGPPFAFVKDNRPVGFDIELSERFAAYLGRELRLSNMEFGSLIAAVSTRKIDMIAASMFITEERRKQIDFSDAYYETGTHAMALKSRIAAAGAPGSAGKRSAPFLASLASSFQSNIIQENRYLLILDGLKTTAIISVLSTVFGSLLGALVCFMRMSKRRLLHLPAKAYISILRGTPVLVVLMLIFYVVFASVDINPALVAVIAFGMNFAAYVAEIYRSGIEGVDRGQTEAGIALGFTRFGTFAHIVLPQTIRRILPVYKGEFISLVKMTSIVGYIAVQDLTKASDIIRSRTFDAFFPLVMVAILYFLISWLLLQSLGQVERMTDPKRRAAARKTA